MSILPIRTIFDERLGIRLLTAGVLAIGLVATAHSAVYKCAAKEGSTTYSDVPCDQKPQVIDVTPDPLHSGPGTPQSGLPTQPVVPGLSGEPRGLTPAAIATAQDKQARELSASLCSTKAFNEWIKTQSRPLPDPNVRMAKMMEISNQCRRPLGLSDMIPPAPIPTPKPILGGVAGAAAAANLVQLVKEGSIESLRKYLATPGVDIDDRPGSDEALLDYAAEQNQAPIANYLIGRGAKVDAVQHKGPNAGYSALHRAAVADAADVASLLLAHGAEVNIHGPLGVTPLILAVSNGSRRTTEVLLQHGADVMTPDGHGQTALSLASARNDTDIVNRLLLHVPAATANSINGAALRGTRVDPFQWPKILVRQDPTTGVEQTWYRLFEVINYPDHPYFPVSARMSGGSLELYTRDGAAPATAGYRTALYALAFRRSGEEPSLMPMTFSPHREMPKEMVYPWSQFAEKADPVTGRVLYFFEGQFLQSDETNTPGWSPFNAWWFDPKAATLTHVVLPDGPWVRDAGSFQFLRGLRGFPIGPSRGYNVALLGGHIVINVLSSDGSLSESTTGTYVLNPTGKAWVKIANSDVKLGDIQIHDCVVSTTGQKQLVEDLCSRQ